MAPWSRGLVAGPVAFHCLSAFQPLQHRSAPTTNTVESSLHCLSAFQPLQLQPRTSRSSTANPSSPLPFGVPTAATPARRTQPLPPLFVSIAFRRSNRCNSRKDCTQWRIGLSPLPFGVPTAATYSSSFIYQPHATSPLPFGVPTAATGAEYHGRESVQPVSIAFRRSNRCNRSMRLITGSSGVSPLPFGVPTAATVDHGLSYEQGVSGASCERQLGNCCVRGTEGRNPR